MAQGFEGYAYLDTDIFLCTGAELPEGMQKLESASGYAGDFTPANSLFTPVNYDWSTFEGSINFDVTDNFLQNQIYPWIFDRESSKALNLYPRGGINTQYTFNECWWTSIDLTASPGSAVTGSIGLLALDRNVVQRKDAYITNKTGNALASTYLKTGNIPALNPSGTQLNPIPFWKSSFTSSTVFNAELVTWNLTFSQVVSKFFKCPGGVPTTPTTPFIIGIGNMTCSLTADFFFHDATFGITNLAFPTVINTFNLTIGNKVFNLKNLQIQNDSDPVRSGSEQTVVSLQMDVYNLT